MEKENRKISSAMIEKLIALNQIAAACKDVYTRIAEASFVDTEFSEDTKKEIVEDVLQRIDMVSDFRTLYSKYYNADDIMNLIAFYRTETGKKLLACQASVVSDVMVLMAYNAEYFSKEVLEEIKKRS